ncbi:hypothetical protein Bca4012_051169 [Brassica carinata]
MAQMVVLQNTKVDIRSLVRKTQKGEFQVEVEPINTGSVEISVGSKSPSESDILEGPFVSDYNDAEAVIVRTSAKEKVNTDLGTSPVNAESDELVSLMPHSDLKSVSIPGGERLWEGALQLSVSSVIFVIGILKSGEKTTTKEWPRLLEIKGRVRLDAFEKFVRELPNYLSRAVMVLFSAWNFHIHCLKAVYLAKIIGLACPTS